MKRVVATDASLGAPPSAPARRRLIWKLPAYGGAIAVLATAVIGARVMGTDFEDLTRDPAATFQAHPLTGYLSNLGVILWTAAAAMALFAGTLLRGIETRREQAAFLLHFGIFTAWLMIDDLYMFHEALAPDDLGIPQPIVIAAYAGWLAFLLVRFRALVLDGDAVLLASSLGFFAVSAAIDQFAPGHWFQEHPLLGFVEDGCKLLGIAGWFGYLVSSSTSHMRSALRF